MLTVAACCWGNRFCSPAPAEALSPDIVPVLSCQLYQQESSPTGVLLSSGEDDCKEYCSWQSSHFQSIIISCFTLNLFRSFQGRNFSLIALFSSRCLKFLHSHKHPFPDNPFAVFSAGPCPCPTHRGLGALLPPAPLAAQGPHSQQSGLGIAVSFVFYT